MTGNNESEGGGAIFALAGDPPSAAPLVPSSSMRVGPASNERARTSTRCILGGACNQGRFRRRVFAIKRGRTPTSLPA